MGRLPPAAYGRKHQQTRAFLIPAAIGTPCHICGQTMTITDKLDLDHNDTTGHGYRGITHAHCNRSIGATKGNQARNQTNNPPSRHW